MAERETVNFVVAGSTPAPGAFFQKNLINPLRFSKNALDLES